jgi:hypothetical protein
MAKQNLVLIETLCINYEIEVSFLNQLNEMGLIELILEKEARYLKQKQLKDLEKMIRLHQELDLNLEGIDVVFNLLRKVEMLQNELSATQNRLKLYED